MKGTSAKLGDKMWVGMHSESYNCQKVGGNLFEK